jgi:hypothetical protein
VPLDALADELSIEFKNKVQVPEGLHIEFNLVMVLSLACSLHRRPPPGCSQYLEIHRNPG